MDEKFSEEVLEYRANILRLLNQVGNPGTCKGCGADIWALNHFANCPKAKEFRR